MLPRLKKVCNKCGGDGKTAQGITPCPQCGLVFQDVKFDLKNLKVDDTPESYIDILLSKGGFSMLDFKKRYEHLSGLKQYKQLEYNLIQLIKPVLTGELPKCSYFVNLVTDELVDSLANTILATMYRCGKKIFPYTRANVLFELKVHPEKFQQYPNYLEYTIGNLYSADMVCIKIDAENKSNPHFIRCITELVDVRADHAKPTLVFMSGSPKVLFSESILNSEASVRQLRKKIQSPNQMTETYSKLLFLGC